MIHEPVQKNINHYSLVGQYFDSIADDYLARSESNPIITEMRQSFRSFTTGGIPNTILDIGCGRGQDAIYFAKRYPKAQVYGIDASKKMIAYADELARESSLTNTLFIHADINDLIPSLPKDQKFDLIYVFFGALNTTSLKESAENINRLLAPGGKAVLTFVNKYYLADFIMNAFKGRLRRALSRWQKIWAGYSEDVSVSSKLYTPSEIKKAFTSLTLYNKKGYSIFYPAWYQADWLKRFPRLCRIFKKADAIANKCFLWKFGEYTLFVFRKDH